MPKSQPKSRSKSRSTPSAIPGERDLIESLRARSGDPSSQRRPVSRFPKKSSAKVRKGIRLGIGDDCAILEPPRGHEILVTTDFSLETIHFRREWHTPESVGHRCLVRDLSDLAAMGAEPMAAFLSLALPAELIRRQGDKPSWRDRFLTGFLALAEKHGVPLAGGDTARSPLSSHQTRRTEAAASTLPGGEITGWALADVVLVGSAPRDHALLRTGAKAADRIYVTGQLGGAAAELAQLTATPRRFRACTAWSESTPNPHPHLFPLPRLSIGAWLLKNRRATAAIDISDGLSTDLDHLCRESGLTATIDAAAIPIHPLAQSTKRTTPEKSLELALHGGDDYELLFTASPRARIPREIASVPVTCIGRMHRYRPDAPRILLASERNGRRMETPLLPLGWEHYK